MRNKTMKDKVKILYFMDGIGNGGGIQEMVIKWMQNIDREKFQIDILSYNRVNKDNFRERVTALGGKVFIIESFQNPKTFIKISFIRISMIFFMHTLHQKVFS